MSPYFVSGCCTVCDELCMEVLARWGENERYPGEPKRLGKPVDGATKTTCLLYGGSLSTFLMCGNCAGTFNPEKYVGLWQKSLRSWLREMRLTPPHPERDKWFRSMLEDGILTEVGRVTFKEASHG